ncbi:hydroxymethylbilane synthase, partial [Actinotalea ferrariae]|nr:hydroxymethylbilane synthase [Actinotalea ferrariae]
AQLRASRPDLVIEDIRGNVDTRLGRVAGGAGPADLDAVVLAAAGLSRLGRLDAVTEYLDPELVAPAPGQGALAVECRPSLLGPGPVGDALRALDHLPTRLAVTAERELLTVLEAGCAAPIGALGHLDHGPVDSWHADVVRLRLDAVVCAPDGGAQVRTSASITLPEDRDGRIDAARTLGEQVAQHLLAAGAGDIADLPGTGSAGLSGTARS